MSDKGTYTHRVSAAGRVNLIGEHVDYCGGKVMPCALSLKNTVFCRPNGENVIRIRWADLPEEVVLDLDRLESYRALKHAKYHAGCAALWRAAGHRVTGCDLFMDCTVPFGSGLSSSAAIEVSTLVALATVAGEPFDPVEVALVAQKAEHEYAGVNCGIMDQFVSANGRAGHAILLDCATLEKRDIPVALGEYTLVITDCKKPHSLVESKYNERRAEVEEALRLIQREKDVSCLAALTPAELEACRADLPALLYRRAKHVVEECDRVRRAARTLEAGDLVSFGKLLNASHESLRTLYEVTGRELDCLAHAAQSHPACLGSRMTGAGFGGCTVSLVKKSEEGAFREYVAERYARETGYTAVFYSAEIADGIVTETL